jgi:hypothetical protein
MRQTFAGFNLARDCNSLRPDHLAGITLVGPRVACGLRSPSMTGQRRFQRARLRRPRRGRRARSRDSNPYPSSPARVGLACRRRRGSALACCAPTCQRSAGGDLGPDRDARLAAGARLLLALGARRRRPRRGRRALAWPRERGAAREGAPYPAFRSPARRDGVGRLSQVLAADPIPKTPEPMGRALKEPCSIKVRPLRGEGAASPATPSRRRIVYNTSDEFPIS